MFYFIILAFMPIFVFDGAEFTYYTGL